MLKLILLGGDLASGKSTYAEKISGMFNVTAVTKDRLKEILGDRFFAKNREENLNLSKGAFDFICYLVEVMQSPLIVESNFKEHETEKLREIAKRRGIDILSLRFTGNDGVLQKRFLKRLEGPRHYVHRAEDFSDLKDFSAMLEGLRRTKYPGKVIEIDSTNFSFASDENLLTKIREFLEK